MRKSTKGALAGVAAVALLLGGFGTRATWSGGATIGGGTITDGSLSLDGSGCGDWQLKRLTDTVFSDVADVTQIFLLPGDVLKRDCQFTVNLKGIASATVAIDTPDFSLSANALSAAGFDFHSTFSKTTGSGGSATTSTIASDAGVAPADGVTVGDGDVISAQFTASLASGATNIWQSVTGTLADMTVTITQAS